MYSVFSAALPAGRPQALLPQPAPVAVLGGCVQAGFPSPADELGGQRVDLNDVLIHHPEATYLMRVRGDSMVGAGIGDGDTLVIDRAITPCHGHVVVAVVDNEFTVKTLWQRQGQVKLMAANPRYPDIVPREGQTLEIWGVVAHAIKHLPV